MSGFLRPLRYVVAAMLALWLCSGAVAAAQAAPPGGRDFGTFIQMAPQPGDTKLAQPKKYNLSGAVVNSVTGEGLPRAAVQLNNEFVTMTDTGGSFVFEGVAAGTYAISARKPGYFDNSEATAGQYRGTVDVDQDTRAVTMKLIPESVISGTITDADGLPVQRLPVQCLRQTIQDGRKQWVSAGDANTDEDGLYRMAGLKPGSYLLVAGPSQMPSIGAMSKIGRQLAGYSAAYYPGPEQGGSSAGFHVSAGQKLTVDLSVDAEPFYSVSGALLGPTGVGGWVRLIARGVVQREGVGAMMRRNTGTFTFRMVAAGDYSLEAQGNFEGKMWAASMPVHVREDITGLQLAMSPTVTIPVNVQVQKTQSAPEQPSGTARIHSAVPLQLLLRKRGEQEPQMFMAAGYQRPNDSTSLAVANLTAGTYAAQFHPMGDLYVASARCGNVDLLRDDLVVTQSATQDPIEVVLRDDGGRVKGTVVGSRDPRSAPGVLVIVPDRGAPYINPEQPQRGSGEFALRQLRPGSYSILVFNDTAGLEFTNLDALEPYMSHAAHIDVSANQETSVSVELIRREAQEGED